MSTTHLNLPIDEPARARLAEQDLVLRLVDTGNQADHAAWSDAVTRGFLGPAEPVDQTEARRSFAARDRLVGVYDATAGLPQQPVATTHSWPAELGLPGGRSAKVWAISGVTVSPTQRRRGIARALIEAELRTAAALGLPIAALTVSESTIYARFGFSPAAFARNLTISTHRVRWTGPATTGRIHHVTPDQLRVDGYAIVERVRAITPGDVSYPADGQHWLRQIGLGIGDDNAKHLRLVRHDDEAGVPQGFAVYQLTEHPSDFTQHTLKLHHLVAATPDAYAALWRYVLEMDLVSAVEAHLRPVDEPLRWMIDDFRAVHVDEVDHLWVRVLDVPAALQARAFATTDRLVLRVDDPLGFADGTFMIDIDPAGAASVTATDDPPHATVTVGALGSLLLGGVPARTLHAAGSVDGDVDRLDEMFRTRAEPFLSTWF